MQTLQGPGGWAGRTQRSGQASGYFYGSRVSRLFLKAAEWRPAAAGQTEGCVSCDSVTGVRCTLPTGLAVSCRWRLGAPVSRHLAQAESSADLFI